MDEKGLNINEIRNALPHRVEPRVSLAEILLDKGMQDDAERAYFDAFAYLDKKEEVSASCFLRPASILKNKSNTMKH